MELPMWQVDAFSAAPFGGNPAAVCLLHPTPGAALPNPLLQAIAAENNLSETAFIWLPMDTPGRHDKADDPGAPAPAYARATRFGLRWFTPVAEVPLCGHATLAAAFVLLEELGNPSPAVEFETLSGILTVRRVARAGRRLLELSLPRAPPVDALPKSLGGGYGGGPSVDGEKEGAARLASLVAACTGGLGGDVIGFARGVDYLLIALPEGARRARLEALRPDFAAMRAAVGADEVHGAIVTAPAEEGDPYDFACRFFGPWLGIDEDPVTGSAFCVLGPYWAGRLGKDQLAARQCSRRGGDVFIDMRPEATEGGRALVSGEGVTTLRGRMVLPPQPAPGR